MWNQQVLLLNQHPLLDDVLSLLNLGRAKTPAFWPGEFQQRWTFIKISFENIADSRVRPPRCLCLGDLGREGGAGEGGERGSMLQFLGDHDDDDDILMMVMIIIEKVDQSNFDDTTEWKGALSWPIKKKRRVRMIACWKGQPSHHQDHDHHHIDDNDHHHHDDNDDDHQAWVRGGERPE